MKALIITAGSLLLTAGVLANAYAQKSQFYPSVVYITKSNPSMAVLYLQAFVFVILSGKVVRKIFFGQLRAAEMEHLIERSWYAVTETCLAFTVFRDDFSPRFVGLFTLLLFLKCFHWLAEDRVDYMERSPLISWLFHSRVISLLSVLGMLDAYFIHHAYYSTLIKGASVQLVFGFEYAILLTVVLTIFVKYILHTIDLQSENPWENKAVYMLYTDLVLGFIKVLLYTLFLGIMIKVHTFPLFAIRPMYLTIRAFRKALNDVIMSRRAIRNMNTLYTDATPEELATGDNVCIICREEMATNCKKLPCNHIFHTSCLRSWFQRQQTCPTCRMDVLRNNNVRRGTQPLAQEQPGQAAQGQPQQPQQPPLGGMFPGFQGGMPFWPPPQPPPAQQGGAAPASSAAADTTSTASSTSTAPRTGDPSMAGMMPPPFMMMPPFMPMMSPFGVAPPMPSPDLQGLTEEELRAMEGQERSHLIARVQCLRDIHSLLDAAMLQIQQYSSIFPGSGLNFSMPTAFGGPSRTPASHGAASTTTTQSTRTPKVATSTASGSPSKKQPETSIPNESTSQSVDKKDSSVDYSELEGAVGYASPDQEEKVPDWEDNNSEDEDDISVVRRRRLERFASKGSAVKDNIELD